MISNKRGNSRKGKRKIEPVLFSGTTALQEASPSPEIENLAPSLGDNLKSSSILSSSSSPHQLKVKVIRDHHRTPGEMRLPSIGGSSVSSLHGSSIHMSSSESVIPMTPATSHMLDLPVRMSRPTSKKGVKSAIEIHREASESLTLPGKRGYS